MTVVTARMKKVPSSILPLIAINRNAVSALYQQVYEAYRSAILRGTLVPGQRVPSTRTLANELGISRIPILNAYAQLLAEDISKAALVPGLQYRVRCQIKHPFRFTRRCAKIARSHPNSEPRPEYCSSGDQRRTSRSVNPYSSE